MTDLIERERLEYEGLLEKIKADNLLQKKARIISTVAATLLGSSSLIKYYFNDDSYLALDAGFGSFIGFLTYQVGTFGHSWAKKPWHILRFLNPVNLLDNYRVSRRISLGDYKAYHEFAKKHRGKVSGTIDEDIYDANIAVSECHDETAVEIVNNLLSVTPKSDFKPNIFRRVVTALQPQQESVLNSPQIEKILDAAYYARTGRPHLAEDFLTRAIETSSSDEEKITALCVYGNYLECKNEHLKAKNAFEDAARNIAHFNDSFADISGTRSRVYVHNSDVIGGAFVFKTGDDNQETADEYRKTEFVHHALGNSGMRFVVPLALVNLRGRTFSITRRAGKFSLRDYIEAKRFSEAFQAAEKSLESALLLHLKTSRNFDIARSNLGEEDIYDLIERKILKNMRDGNTAEDQYLSTSVHTLANEIDSWRGVLHGDFHPGNIMMNNKGEVCIIDLEKTKVSAPYLDAVTLVDNYRTRDIFNQESKRENLFAGYCGNTHDGGAVDSHENAARSMHLAGVLQNLMLFYHTQSIGSLEESDAVKEHHKTRCIAHLNDLEGFYSGMSLHRLRDFRNALENRLNHA